MSFRTLTAVLACAATLLIAAAPARRLDAATGSVTGKVIGSDGAAQQDVVVKLLPAAVPGKPADPASPPVTAKTDKDGKFTIDKVQPGSFRVVAGDKLRGVAIKEVTV